MDDICTALCYLYCYTLSLKVDKTVIARFLHVLPEPQTGLQTQNQFGVVLVRPRQVVAQACADSR